MGLTQCGVAGYGMVRYGPVQRGEVDPLAGLPPTWQAFWATVPHLNPQATRKLATHLTVRCVLLH